MSRDLLGPLRGRPGPGLVALALGLVLGLLTGLALTSEGKPRLAGATGGKGSQPGATMGGGSGASVRTADIARIGDATQAVDKLIRSAEVSGDLLGVAVAPLRSGEPLVRGLDRARAWSAIKPSIIATYLRWRQRDRRGDGWLRTDAGSRVLAERALIDSNNQATRALVRQMAEGGLGYRGAAAAIERVLREGGVEATVPAEPTTDAMGPYLPVGTTEWRLDQALGFYRRLVRGCLLTGRDLVEVLALMRQAVDPPNDRIWGVNRAFLRRTIETKGGDGINPKDGKMTVEQFSIVGRGRDALAIGVMATMAQRLPADGLEKALTPQVKAVLRSARQLIAGVGRAVRRVVGLPTEPASTLPPRSDCPRLG